MLVMLVILMMLDEELYKTLVMLDVKIKN